MKNLPNSILTKKQVKNIIKKNVLLDGVKVDAYIKVRYDDECGNNHNSFAITSTIYESGKKSDKYMVSGGCNHDDIVKVAPELEYLIKWHLMSSDAPLHYISNTLYHARDRENMTLPLGSPTDFKKYLKFKNIPFTFNQQSSGFWDYLENVGDFNNIDIKSIAYEGDYALREKYSFTGFIKENETKQWYKAPFDNEKSALEFLQALQNNEYEIIEIPTQWNKAVKPDIEAARRCAIWSDATLDQLQNKESLESRLCNLVCELKQDIEQFGFIF